MTLQCPLQQREQPPSQTRHLLQAFDDLSSPFLDPSHFSVRFGIIWVEKDS